MLVGVPTRKLGADGPIQFPGPNVNGYQILEKTDTAQPAPEGYEGETHILSETVVGNNPATAGERYVLKINLGNQIKECPQADGTAEGQGSFSTSFDYTAGKAEGITNTHVVMVANAKYKGQVGDNALFDGPVNADIDYSFTQTSTFRRLNGPLVTLPAITEQQPIIIPFFVSIAKNGDLIPKIGAASGGDPTKTRYSNAWDVGIALTFWAGVYYAFAEAHWTTRDMCVQTEFTPPSKTVKLVLGGETTVKTEIKTYTGERVKAQYPVIKGYDSVQYTQTYSDVGMPLQFTYTAPSQKPSNPSTTLGVKVEATSRAGIAEGWWEVGLGTGWSGLITCEKIIAGDQGSNDLQVWNNSSATRITITVKDGEAKAIGYTEIKGMQRTRQPKYPSGYLTASSDYTSGTNVDGSDFKLQVNIDKVRGTYSIKADYLFKKEGTRHTYSCSRDKCHSDDFPLGIEPILKGMEGKLDDPNHLHGTKSEVSQGVGYIHNGTLTLNTTWDLARQGTSQ